MPSRTSKSRATILILTEIAFNESNKIFCSSQPTNQRAEVNVPLSYNRTDQASGGDGDSIYQLIWR